MQGATQKEIAAAIGVSDRTIWTWIHQYSWDKLRLAAYQAPAIISDNLCSQIVELQNAIAARPVGSRYATMQEAEIMRKLIVMLEKMKKTPSLSQNMQMLETFRNYVRPIDPEFSRKLANHAEHFLEGQSINGYAPYQPEHGVESVPPVMPFFPETDEDEVEKVPPSPERIKSYSIPSFHYQQQQAYSVAAHQPKKIEENAQQNEDPLTIENPIVPAKMPAIISPNIVEENSQFPEAQQLQNSATPTPRKGLPWLKRNRSSSTTQTTTATATNPTPPDVHTGNEPEVFSQLAPTG